MKAILSIIILLLVAMPIYANDKYVLVADSVKKIDNDTLEASGNVILKVRDIVFSSDELQYNSNTKDIIANGNVKIKSDVQTLEADSFSFNLDTETGKAKNINGFLEPNNYICAEEFEKTGDITFTVHNARISTCSGATPDWSVQMYKGDYEIEGYLNAEHATADVLNSPLIYIPKLIYPVATKRKSGFLLPNVGIDSEKGAFFNLKYYWAPINNFDMTLGATLFTKSGIQEQLEFRYADSPNSNLYTTFNRIDDFTSQSIEHTRWHLESVNKYTFVDNFEINLNADFVSDYLYIRDFGDYDLSNSPANQNSNTENMFYAEIQAKYYNDYANINATTRMDKEYRDTSNGHQISTLVQTPSISVSKAIPIFSFMAIDYELSYNSLSYNQIGYNAPTTGEISDISYDRLHGATELYFPINTPFFTITPSVGFEYTYWFNTSEPFKIQNEYKQPFSGIEQINDSSAQSYTTSTAVSLAFNEIYRQYSSFRHSIQNVVSFNYSPNISLSGIPLLTSYDSPDFSGAITYEMVNFLDANKWSASLHFSQSYDWLQSSEILPLELKLRANLNRYARTSFEMDYKHSGDLVGNEQRIQYLTNTTSVNLFNMAWLTGAYTFDSTIEPNSNNTDVEIALSSSLWRFDLSGYYRWSGYNPKISFDNLIPYTQGAKITYHTDCWSLGFEVEVDSYSVVTQAGIRSQNEVTFYLNYTLTGIGDGRLEFLRVN